MDILSTTSNPIMIKGVHRDELPVVYDAPKPKKILFTEDDLYKSDKFSFGTKIGSITNKSSNGYALLSALADRYGDSSQEYRLVKSRLKQCCAAQSRQIDKTKIGQNVKDIPGVWVNFKKFKTNKHGEITDRHYRRKELYNTTLLDKYPYFFRYVYKDTDKAYRNYVDKYNTTCLQKYQMTFTELETFPDKNEEQQVFINNFYKHCPVVNSNSSMNMLCKHIESINIDILGNVKSITDKRVYNLYKSDMAYEHYYDDVVQVLKEANKKLFIKISADNSQDEDGIIDLEKTYDLKSDRDILYDKLLEVCPKPQAIVNCLVDYYYIERPMSNKDVLWSLFGNIVYRNIKRNTNVQTALFPMPDENGDIYYLGYRYKLEEVTL